MYIFYIIPLNYFSIYVHYVKHNIEFFIFNFKMCS
jgi:hypothetical protein